MGSQRLRESFIAITVLVVINPRSKLATMQNLVLKFWKGVQNLVLKFWKEVQNLVLKFWKGIRIISAGRQRGQPGRGTTLSHARVTPYTRDAHLSHPPRTYVPRGTPTYSVILSVKEHSCNVANWALNCLNINLPGISPAWFLMSSIPYRYRERKKEWNNWK